MSSPPSPWPARRAAAAWRLCRRAYRATGRWIGRALCAASRRANRALTGRSTAICTDAFIRGSRYRIRERVLNIVMFWRDWRNHCCRSAAQDAVQGVYDGEGFGLNCRR